VELTILGSSPSWPNPGEASSGYLVETAAGLVLLDCGSGVLGRFRAATQRAPRAVVLSHLDPDHIVDLFAIMFAIRYGPLEWPGAELYAPPGGRVVLDEVLTAFGLRLRDLEAAIRVREYRAATPTELEDVSLSFFRTRHSAHSYATRLEDASGSLVYTGDTAPTPGLAEHARDCDLLLCEASMGAVDLDPGTRRVHLTAHEAAELARDAGAGQVVLTHLDAADREPALAAARAVFDRVELALPGATFRF
jgi:ribonuclease BN (tRNA processing enzyme)